MLNYIKNLDTLVDLKRKRKRKKSTLIKYSYNEKAFFLLNKKNLYFKTLKNYLNNNFVSKINVKKRKWKGFIEWKRQRFKILLEVNLKNFVKKDLINIKKNVKKNIKYVLYKNFCNYENYTNILKKFNRTILKNIAYLPGLRKKFWIPYTWINQGPTIRLILIKSKIFYFNNDYIDLINQYNYNELHKKKIYKLSFKNKINILNILKNVNSFFFFRFEKLFSSLFTLHDYNLLNSNFFLKNWKYKRDIVWEKFKEEEFEWLLNPEDFSKEQLRVLKKSFRFLKINKEERKYKIKVDFLLRWNFIYFMFNKNLYISEMIHFMFRRLYVNFWQIDYEYNVNTRSDREKRIIRNRGWNSWRKSEYNWHLRGIKKHEEWFSRFTDRPWQVQNNFLKKWKSIVMDVCINYPDTEYTIEIKKLAKHIISEDHHRVAWWRREIEEIFEKLWELRLSEINKKLEKKQLSVKGFYDATYYLDRKYKIPIMIKYVKMLNEKELEIIQIYFVFRRIQARNLRKTIYYINGSYYHSGNDYNSEVLLKINGTCYKIYSWGTHIQFYEDQLKRKSRIQI